MVQQPLSPTHGARQGSPSAKVVFAGGPPNEVRHIALVGMPGTGKTSVGARLAEALSLDFVDLDAAIEEAAQKSVAAVFAEQGEVMFRAKERARLREVLARVTPTVIACGGGTWADATMQRELVAAARPILLTAPIDTLLGRLEDGSARRRRPLLHGPDPRAALERLWRSREAMHARCPHRVDTDARSVDEVVQLARQLLADTAPQAAEAPAAGGGDATVTTAHGSPTEPTVQAAAAPEVAHAPEPEAAPESDAAAMAAAPVQPAPTASSAIDSSPTSQAQAALAAALGPDEGEAAVPLLQAPGVSSTYPVYLLREGAQAVAECIDAFSGGNRIGVISDTGVSPNHAERLLEALRARGLEVSLHAFASGEESKRLATAHALYDELADVGHGRGDLLVSLGGGLVSDVAGFVASTYMRGVPFLQVPTSTLAAVDACIGSKTGLNTRRGKNLVGSFYDPQAVVIAMPYLGTQAPRAHVAGLVEALKVAALADAELFAAMLQAPDLSAVHAPDALGDVIARALRIKAQIVAQDVGERGQRALLNFGHTIGHAIEIGEDYRLLHGEAIGLGMVAEAEFAEGCGLANGVVEPLIQALAAMGVPTDWRRARLDVAAMSRDKKRRGDALVLPVVMPLGQARLHHVPLADLTAFVAANAR